ncbi:PASTA domain-containing protein [Blastococcus sp. TML/M2B]|uniref:PASTA domain-containing protein n=1 Tax=unclassified Blastococcus TaxID=2619396 RepID=UPI00190A1145|nr:MULTISPECIES: PASTA domain-containing protein [unclassified Blastococcus]MBN1093317.1 PASTA domain-containing protein [Blastococcus sp. TML/M2B]MBN1096568.1 PASTA domain-containing protein [Blastococcus sp. TML/C7B]
MAHPTGAGPQSSALPWWVVVGGLAVIGIGGAVVGGLSGEAGTSAAATTSSSSASASAAPRAAATTTPTTTAPSSTVPPAPTPQATSSAPSASTVDFVMPDLVGSDLQSAQDAVQELGVFYSVSHDLLGSRNQVLDSNWIVCDQNVPPGQRVTGDVEGQLDFGVVKREETCP